MPSITDSWIRDQIDMLWERCPFKPKGLPFLVNPKYFYDIPTYKDKIIFLMKRFSLPFEEVQLYMHADLERPGKVVLNRVFDIENIMLKPAQKIMSLNDDGTYAIFDMSDPLNPHIITVNESLPIKHIRLSMFLNKDFITSKEAMGAIMAHEVSHLYLYFNGLQEFNSSSELRNPLMEYLTDITAFVIGLGNLMLNGCVINKRTIHHRDRVITEEIRLGYLSPEQMKLAHEEVLARI